LGGAVTQSLNLSIVEKQLKNFLTDYEKDLQVVPTRLKEESGLWGALYQGLTLTQKSR